MIRNKYTGQVLHASETTINGAWIVRQGTVELHRGNKGSARAFLANMVEHGIVWEWV